MILRETNGPIIREFEGTAEEIRTILRPTVPPQLTASSPEVRKLKQDLTQNPRVISQSEIQDILGQRCRVIGFAMADIGYTKKKGTWWPDCFGQVSDRTTTPRISVGKELRK